MPKRPHPTNPKSAQAPASSTQRRGGKKLLAPSETVLERIVDLALPLVSGKSEPSPGAYMSARTLILKVVLENDHTAIEFENEVIFPLACELSASFLPGYATLDSDHMAQIKDVIASIEDYVADTTQKRPLNFLMLASPGAGKSHFIRCLARRLNARNVGAITFNMTGLQRNEDLIPPLDAARNLKVQDRLPLLFLDEFDSKPGNAALLLPLLWDGELNLGQRDLKLGKVVIVLAGSDPGLPGTMDYALSMRQELPSRDGGSPKLIDLLSRINGGVLQIQPFYDPSRGIDRRSDKICITAELLRQRFGPQLRSVSLALLTFIAQTEFRYGVRSIAHLIDLIRFQKDLVDLTEDHLNLPLQNPHDLKDSSLAYHLIHKDGAHGVAELWNKVSSRKSLLAISSPATGYTGAGLMPEGYIRQFTHFLVRRLAEEVRRRRNNAG